MYATVHTLLAFLISKIQCTEFKKSQSTQGRLPISQCCHGTGTGISGTATFCLSGTRAVMHSCVPISEPDLNPDPTKNETRDKSKKNQK